MRQKKSDAQYGAEVLTTSLFITHIIVTSLYPHKVTHDRIAVNSKGGQTRQFP